jgi:CRP/FNR family transcriptional regulator
MENIIEIMSKTPLFGGLSAEQLEKIKQITVAKTYDRGQPIFWEGDKGTGFYIVASGKVKIYKASPEGKEQILHIYGPGKPFGEVPVFSGDVFPATAVAMMESRLLYFPRQGFIDLITANPSLALNMLAVLSVRLRQFTVQVENLSLKEVPGRLATYLIYLSKEQKSTTSVDLPVSKGQLAGLLGTIPETLSRIFNKMSAQGLIEVQGSQIRLLQLEGLEELAVHGRLGEDQGRT